MWIGPLAQLHCYIAQLVLIPSHIKMTFEKGIHFSILKVSVVGVEAKQDQI